MCAANGLDSVSRETLERFAEHVLKWTSKINLIGRSTTDDIWNRHILDSVYLADLLDSSVKSWADLGAGGGFPGVVIAILRPNTHVTLVESDQRKAAFLRSMRRELGVDFSVESKRIEDLDPINADVVSARALAPLQQLFPLAYRHMRKSGHFLFPKGSQWEREIADIQGSWNYTIDVLPPSPHSDGVVLHFSDIQDRHANT